MCERCGFRTCRCVHVYNPDRELLRIEAPYDAEKRRQIMFPKVKFNTMAKRPEGDWLTSREYAALIGRDISTVTNGAHKHGGVRVNGRWWFPPPKQEEAA